MGVSNRIKELRERAGLSQIELANMVGVDANQLEIGRASCRERV